MEDNEASKTESGGGDGNKPGSVPNSSPNSSRDFPCHKLKKIYSLLFVAGSAISLYVVIKAYFLNYIIKDYNFNLYYVVYPMGITLAFGTLLLIVQLIYEYSGYGEINNFYNMTIDKRVNLKNILLLFYSLVSFLFIPLCGYVGIYFLFLVVMSIYEKII